MARSAGTLETTHNATFIPPRLMPGYRGHCPTTKYDYGETYGKATAKYFQDHRSSVLRASHDPYARGGDFPTYYSHRPEVVLSARARAQDRWLATPKYSLDNVDFDRKEELYAFDKLSQIHREHYSDKTGTRPRADYFLIPVSDEERIKKRPNFMILATRHTDDIQIPAMDRRTPHAMEVSPLDRLGRRLPKMKRVAQTSSQRDREMRDVYFESR